MKNVLVVGSEGQLGKEFQQLVSQYPTLQFQLVDRNVLDITNETQVREYFSKNPVDVCINCAAYTAVDKAEEDEEQAFQVNVLGVKYLAKACELQQTLMIHLSTDFVFDGNASRPYREEVMPNPLSVYGQTKLAGEQALLNGKSNVVIIRTSWLYSSFGANFVKTMCKLAQSRDKLGVVADQVGTPTYAGDLAQAIMKVIVSEEKIYGVFHYSNEGAASWYDFAKAVFDLTSSKVEVTPLATHEYPTPAQRPFYSVLDKTKFKEEYQLYIPYWRDSLKECLDKMEQEITNV